MNSSLHTVSALLVSASEAQTKRIGALLTRARIVPFEHADSARQALDLFDGHRQLRTGAGTAAQKAALHGGAAAG